MPASHIFIHLDSVLVTRCVYNLEKLADDIAQHFFGQSPHLAVDNFSIGDKKHCRDSLDVIFSSPLLVIIGIDFCNH